MAAAKAMPDEGSREDLHKTLRIEMRPLLETCLIMWGDMSSHIREAFGLKYTEFITALELSRSMTDARLW